MSEGHPFDGLRAGSESPVNPSEADLHSPFSRNLLGVSARAPGPLATKMTTLEHRVKSLGREIGFDNLAPIIWHKIANAVYEVAGGGGFLGKPYEPNAVIKNDIEYILMLRKPGGYRKPTLPTRILSLISAENHQKWFQQIWTGLTGASTKNHPAPYPVELAERLVRMFSFVGDTVLDPFMGTGTTTLAASKSGRNSIGVELDPVYFKAAQSRIKSEVVDMFSETEINVILPDGNDARP